jgi:hypothetical protein
MGAFPAAAQDKEVPMPVMKKRAKRTTKSRPMKKKAAKKKTKKK